MLGQKHLFAELEELQKEGGPIEVKYVSDFYEIYSSRIIGDLIIAHLINRLLSHERPSMSHQTGEDSNRHR